MLAPPRQPVLVPARLGPVRAGLARDGRSVAIEGLRGVVVVTVIAYHLLRLLLTRHGGSWGSTTTAWWWWAGIARFAVDAFFVLAGMFIVASWRSVRRRSASLGAAVRGYAGRRGRRILPLFWLVGLTYGVPLLVAGVIGWHELGLFLTTQGYLDQRLPDLVDLPSWSMTTEVQFYVVAPLVAVAVRWWRGWPLLAVAWVGAVAWIHWPGRGDLAASLLPGRIDQFVAGAVVGELVAAGSASAVVRWVGRPRAGVVLLSTLLALGVWHGATYQQAAGNGVLGGWLEEATHPLGGLVIAALVLRWVTGPAPRFLSATPWRFLGLISFGLYLWHYPILHYGLDWLGIRGRGVDPSGPVVLLACAALVLLSVAVATLTYILVESQLAAERATGSPAHQNRHAPLPVAATAAS